MRHRNEGPSRRAFLAGLGATATLVACGDGSGGGVSGSGRGTSPSTRALPGDGPRLPSDPFTMGVASGDPIPGSVVLWTRLAPEPLAPGGRGGMPDAPIPVGWEVARDPGMQDVVARGTVEADPAFAHAVHVDLWGMPANRWLWYRFTAGGFASPVGRTRGAPPASSSPERLRFALASCQAYTSGFYTPYPHMLREDIDLVVFVGDYIYEGGVSGIVRDHDGPEVRTLDAYRNRYALYKSEPNLMAAHQAFPWVVTWDDHEVSNNHHATSDSERAPTEEYLQRRAAAYRAYYEHMPLRVGPPVGASFPIHRKFAWGDLADLWVLDGRQYRSPPACGSSVSFLCPERLDPARTMLGADQEAWLLDGLGRSAARWQLLAQQVMFGTLDFGGIAFNGDQWDGYYAARQRILDHVAARNLRNFVVLTGDIHSSWVMDLSLVPGDPSSPLVGTELVGTSISTIAAPVDIVRIAEDAIVDQAPLIHYVNLRERGYVVCDVSAQALRADYRLVTTVFEPTAPIRSVASWEIPDGRPGATRI